MDWRLKSDPLAGHSRDGRPSLPATWLALMGYRHHPISSKDFRSEGFSPC